MELDLNKLVKRPSFPFETIAVGLAFSPRMSSVISESYKISNACNSKLVLIHVGTKTKDKQKILEDELFKNNIDERKVKVIWTEGDVVDTILKLCKLNIVDLLILGALEKESILRFYLGSVARNISRKAKCSVLLVAKETKTAYPQKKVIVKVEPEHPKTAHSINTALYFAKNMGIREISMVHEIHAPAMAMAMADSSSAPEVTKMKKDHVEGESSKLHHLVTKCDTGMVKVNEKVVKGKPGYAIRQYADTKKADLLVINSPDMSLTLFDRIFTHDIEYILADLPCNLLIVHSRV